MSPTASPIPMATSSTLGPGHRRRRHRRQSVSRRLCSPATSTFRTSTPRRRRFISSARVPVRASSILSSRHFPEEMQGNLLVANVIGFQGILQYKIQDKEASFGGTEVEPILSSSDPNFRPADLEIGPDGASISPTGTTRSSATCSTTCAIPAAIATHGRVYRVTYEGRPLVKPAKIAGEPIEKLLDLLKDPEDRVRYRAQDRTERPRQNEVSRPRKTLDRRRSSKNDPRIRTPPARSPVGASASQRRQRDSARRVLASPDFHARAAGDARALLLARSGSSDALTCFKRLAADEHPRVRLEAVRAASFFTEARSGRIPVIAAEQPGTNTSTMCAARHSVRSILTGSGPWPTIATSGSRRRRGRATCCRTSATINCSSGPETSPSSGAAEPSGHSG